LSATLKLPAAAHGRARLNELANSILIPPMQYALRHALRRHRGELGNASDPMNAVAADVVPLYLYDLAKPRNRGLGAAGGGLSSTFIPPALASAHE